MASEREAKESPVVDQCTCHLASLDSQCALKRAHVLSATNNLFKYIKSKGKDYSLDLEFTVGDLHSVLNSSIQCPVCKDHAFEVCTQLASAATKGSEAGPLTVEASDAQDHKVTWVLQPSSTTQGAIKAKTLTQQELKANKPPTQQRPSAKDDEHRLFEYLRSSTIMDERKLPTPDQVKNGRKLVDDLLRQVVNLIMQLRNPMLSTNEYMTYTHLFAQQTEEVIFCLETGYSYMAMFQQNMPQEVESDLRDIRGRLEPKVFEKICRATSPDVVLQPSPQAVCTTLLELCQIYLSVFNKSTALADSMFASLDVGRKLYSLHNNSYVFANTPYRPSFGLIVECAFTLCSRTAHYPLGAASKITEFYAEAKSYAKRMVIASSNLDNNTASRELALLRYFIARQHTNLAPGAKRHVASTATELFGIGKIPMDRLDDMAERFWRAVDDRDAVMGDLGTHAYQAPNSTQMFACDMFYKACMLQQQANRAYLMFGELDWALARFNKPARCTGLDKYDEMHSFALQHAISAALEKRAFEYMDTERKEAEAKEKAQAEAAAKAQADLLKDAAAEEAAAKKKRKKKQQQQHQTKKPEQSPVVVIEEGPPAPVEEEKLQVEEKPVQEAAFIEEEGEEDEWEEVAKKKPASKEKAISSDNVTIHDYEVNPTGSNLHYQEAWTSRKSCLVRLSNAPANLAMSGGEYVKAVRKTGAQLEQVSKNSDFRFFQVMGKTPDQVNKCLAVLRSCVDDVMVKDGPAQNFPLTLEAGLSLLEDGAKQVWKLQRDTKTHLIISPDHRNNDDSMKLVIRGTPQNVANCVAALKAANLVVEAAPTAAPMVSPPVAHITPPLPVEVAKTQQELDQEAQDELLARQLAQEEEANFAEAQKKAQSITTPPAAPASPAPRQPSFIVASSPAYHRSTIASIATTAPVKFIKPDTTLLQDVTSSFTLIAKQRKDNMSILLTFPQSYIGKIMGAGSANVKQWERDYRVAIEQVRTDDRITAHTRRLQIKGSSDNTEQVYRKIKQLIGEDRTFVLPPHLHAKLSEKIVYDIEHMGFAKVYVHPIRQQPSGNYLVTVTSPHRDNIATCKFLLESVGRGHTVKESLALYAKEQDKKKNDTTGLVGLSNARGENSCFLNVVVQSLFHFSRFSCDVVRGDTAKYNKLAQSLQSTFRALGQGDAEYVNSSELRAAVSDAFAGSFVLGEMDDAVEAFLRVLSALHNSLTHADTANAGVKPSEEVVCDCLVHRNFASYVFQGVHCTDCNQRVPTSPNWPHLVLYVNAQEIIRQPSGTPFPQRVRQVLTNVNPMCCPKCDKEDKRFPIQFTFTKTPTSVFSLGIVWSSEQPDLEREVGPLLKCIGEDFDLSQLFDLERPMQMKRKYKLRGMICFSHKHYIAMFRRRQSMEWFEFDDHKVKPVGTTWAHTYRAMLQKQFHPVIIFFEEA